MLRFATALCLDPGTAQEIVQEVAYRASTRWSRIESLSHPGAYLRRMVVNEYLSWHRKWGRVTASSDLIDGALDPERDATADVDDRHHLRAELAKLPPRQRAVIVLRFYEDLNDAEIAAALGCPRGTVRSLQSRALKRLRVEMDEDPRPAAPKEQTPRLVIADQRRQQES